MASLADESTSIFSGLHAKILRAMAVMCLLLTIVVYASFLRIADPASVFYALQAATLLALWLAVKVGSGVDFLRLAIDLSNVALCPSWIPHKCFVAILQSQYIYPVAAYSLIPLLASAAVRPDLSVLRLLVVLVSSIFQLGECSRTSSHRDYLMVYNCWSLFFFYKGVTHDPSQSIEVPYTQAIALGLAVHFVTASGLAKLTIGGFAWGSPATMQAVLRTFAAKRKEEGGPILPRLNQIVRGNDFLSGACAVGTLVFECILAPLTLVLPSEFRIGLGYGMLLLHVGIAILQSGAIGAFFLPTSASYVFGLCSFGTRSTLDVGTAGWFCAVLVFVVMTIGNIPLGCRCIREDWPMTPYALFPWSAEQWVYLHTTFVSGHTRLVFSVAEPVGGESPLQLVGRKVIPLEHRSDIKTGSVDQGKSISNTIGAAANTSEEGKAEARLHPRSPEPVLYDMWNRLVGVTTFQNQILEALKEEFQRIPQQIGSDWDATNFTQCVQDWLNRTGRMIEISSGQPLVKAYFVKVVRKEADGGEGAFVWVVQEVLCQGTRPLKRPLLADS